MAGAIEDKHSANKQSDKSSAQTLRSGKERVTKEYGKSKENEELSEKANVKSSSRKEEDQEASKLYVSFSKDEVEKIVTGDDETRKKFIRDLYISCFVKSFEWTN